MNILKRVGSWFERFRASDVLDDMLDISKMTKETVVAPHDAANNAFKSVAFESRDIKGYQSRFKSEVDTRFRGNCIEVTGEIAKRFAENLTELHTLMESVSKSDIFTKAITYKQANIISYVNMCDFAMKYARLKLIHILCEETSLARNNEKINLNKVQYQWLADKEYDFFKVMSLLDTPTRELLQNIKKAPDSIVSEESYDELGPMVGFGVLDVFDVRRVSFPNPFRYFGMMYVEMKVERWKAAKAEAKQLELELMDLILARDGKSDAMLDSQIEYYKDAVATINRKIKKFEDDVNGN